MDFHNKNIAFTGKLTSMKRERAVKLLAPFGAVYQSTVNQKTDILVVVGHSPTFLFEIDTRTKKRKAADKLIDSGKSIVILTEKDFLTALEGQLLQLEKELSWWVLHI